MVKDRDGWRCTDCGRAGRLQVDHRTPLALGGAPYDLDNLATVCERCHFRKTALENEKPDPERDQWRAYISSML